MKTFPMRMAKIEQRWKLGGQIFDEEGKHKKDVHREKLLGVENIPPWHDD